LRLSQYKCFSAEAITADEALKSGLASATDRQTADLPQLIVRRLGLQEYEPIWQAMRYLALNPKADRADEIWMLSHKPVYTQGQAGKAEHILNPGNIPVVQIDRGGQVTYHGPGQLVAYLLIDVKRRKMGVKDLVNLIESALIAGLADFGIEGRREEGAPGVYVGEEKIAALGLRIKNGRSYHGLSLNVNMDLKPFKNINPCGYQGLSVTRIADHYEEARDAAPLMQRVSEVLCDALLSELGYKKHYNG